MSSKKFNYNSPHKHIDIFQKLYKLGIAKKTNRNIIVLDIRVQSFTYFFDDDKSFKTEDQAFKTSRADSCTSGIVVCLENSK